MNNDEFAIKVEHVSKTFRLPHDKNSSIKGAVINFYKRKRSFEKQEVLKDISFEIKKGEFFGIVGRNGSGKSTLLKLLAGIYEPDQGTISINGKLTPFIELGVGFNQELTGQENVYLNGALLGFSRQEIKEMYSSIVEFAELERFMDQKLKNYSSGMQVRLAFSIAIRAQGAILLLDEVLAVGDAVFQQKCFDYFKELKKNSKTVILVSHDSVALEKYCEMGIFIEKGKILSQGKIKAVINDYTESLNRTEEISGAKASTKQSDSSERWGTGEIQITNARTADMAGVEKNVFTDVDKSIKLIVEYKARSSQAKPVYGVTISDAAGVNVFVSNTVWSEVVTNNVRLGEKIELEWEIPNIFNTGNYFVSPAVASSEDLSQYDWRERYSKFKVRKRLQSSAIANVDHQITLKRGS